MARLRGLFLKASGEGIAYELAQQMLQAAGKNAILFLIEQSSGDGYLAEAAIKVLQEGATITGEALVRALEASPNSQNLARALPLTLSAASVHRLLDLIPEVTDAPTLRYLTQRIAQASPQSRPELAGARDLAADEDCRLAICTGLAAAGDESALADLQQRLPQANNAQVRLMLSCRALAQSPAGIEALRALLHSGSPGDRAYALVAVTGLDLTELAQDAASVFVGEEHDGVMVKAFDALSVVVPHLTRQQLEAVVREACGLSDLGSSTPDAVAASAKTCVGRLTRARFLIAQCNAGDARLHLPVVLAAAEAVGSLTPQLVATKPVPAAMEAASHLLGLQRSSVTALWEANRQQAAALRMKVGGGLTVEMLGAWGWEDSRAGAKNLLNALKRECDAGAMLTMRAQALEYPEWQREGVDAHLARSALRRLSVLARLGQRSDLMPAVVEALRSSREREATAAVKVERCCGAEAAAQLQAELDQRLLVLEEPARLAGGYVRRQNRGRTPACPPELAVRLLSEQILQADLCALLGLRPLSSSAVGQLIAWLSSRSALVSAAAQRALVCHPEETTQLRQRLLSEADQRVQARLLEVLRCLGSPRSREFARQAVAMEDELLQAAAVRYLGQFGKLDDLTPHQATLAASGGLVRVVALRTTMTMLAGPAAGVVRLLADGLTALSPAHALATEQRLLTYPREIVAPVLAEYAAGNDALARVRAQRLLKMAEQGWPTEELAPCGGVTVPVAGDDVLGQTLMVPGEGPFEWGLPALPAELPPRLDEYEGLLRHDERIAAAWDQWGTSGVSPLRLLPYLQEKVAAGGADGATAEALALDIMDGGLAPYLAAFVNYHCLPVDDDLEQRMDRVLRETFLRCTPDVVAGLQVSNPSSNALFSEMLSTSLRGEVAGPVFCLAFGEMLKKSLSDELSVGVDTPPPEADAQFMRYVEREWDDLRRFPDDYYGFWVWPRLSLADMGRYCSTRRARKVYRAEISRYLGYLATSLPAFGPRTEEARAGLIACVQERLDAASRSILDGQKRAAKADHRTDWEPVRKRIRSRLHRRLDEAIATFDIHWLSPHPIFPLGTLPMACEQIRPFYGRGSSLFPESHLSFVNLLEKRITELVREERPERRDPLVVASTDEPPPGGDEPKELGQTREDARQFEERRAERLHALGNTGEVADEAYAAAPSPAPRSEPQEVEIGGEIGEYYDLDQVAYHLRCHPDTLK